MTRTPYLLAFSLALVAGSACQCPVATSVEQTPPTLSAVEPDRGTNDVAQTVRIVGQYLVPDIYRDLTNPDGVSVDATFTVRLGATVLRDVTWIDEQHLRAVVPAGIPAGVYALSVETPLGLTATLAEAYTAIEPSVLQISGVAPADLVNDAAATLTVTGEGFGAGLVARLLPTSGAAVELTPANVQPGSFTAVVPAGLAAGSYDLQLESAEAGQAEATDAVAVWEPAALSVSASLSQAVVSVGQTFSLTVHVANGGGSSSTGVTAAAPVPEVAGLVARSAGPTPASADVAPAATQDFVFSYTAASPGSLHFTLGAQGVNAFSGRANVAAAAVSGALTIQPPAALALGIALDATQLVVGQQLTVTVTASNLGVAPATGVVPTLTPDTTGPLTLSSGPSPAQATVGGQQSAQFTYVLQAAAAGDVTFTATAQGLDANSGATVLAPGVSSSTVHVLASGAALVASLAVPAQASEGQSFDVVMTVQNTGAVGATGVAPSLESPTGTGVVVQSAGPVPASVDLAAGASQTFTYTYTAQGAGDVLFAGAASGVDSQSSAAVSSARATASALLVQTPASLSAAWSGLPALLTQGQGFQLTLTVSNAGEATASDVAATAATVVGSTGTSCGAASPVSASIAGGASQAFVYACVAGNGSGALSVDASAAGSDLNSGAAVATGTTSSSAAAVQGPPVLQLAHQIPGTVVVGDSFNVVVVVTNAGEAGALGVAPTAPPAPSDASAVTLVSGPLPASADVAGGGDSASFTYVFAAASPATLHFASSVAGSDANSGDAVQAGPADSADLLVQPPADLRAVLAGPSLVSTGQSFDVTMTVTNQGVVDVNGVQPSTLSVVPSSAASVLVAPTAPWPNLSAGGGSAQFTWTLQVTGSSNTAFHVEGVASGTAVGSGASVDSLLARSSDTTVQAAAALAGAWSAPARVTSGLAFVATLRVTNAGQAAAQGVVAEAATVNGSTGTSCGAPSPAAQDIPGGATRSFDYACTAGASSGDATIGAGAQGADLNSGAAVSAATAESDPVQVQSAPALVASFRPVPATVTRGQSFTLTLSVDNSGEAEARDVAAAGAVLSGATGTTCGAASPTSSHIAGGGQALFTYACVAGGASGAVAATSSASGLDANSGLDASSNADSSDDVTVQSAPQLTAQWTSVPAVVTYGQSFVASLTVDNGGEAGAVDVVADAATLVGGTGTTCEAASPTSADIAGGASQVFTYTCLAGSTAGGVTLSAGAGGDDANSGAAVAAAADLSASIAVQEPPAFTLQWQVPVAVNRNQSFQATLHVTNNGSNAANGVAVQGLTVGGGTGTSCGAPSPTSASLAAGGSQDFLVDCTAGTASGSATLEASVQGTDAVGGSTVSAGPETSSGILVQTPAALQVVSVVASASTVYRKQTGVLVTVEVANTGEAGATVAPAGSWLLFTAGAADVAADYSVTVSAGSPTAIAGGISESFGFVVDVDPGATLGTIDLDAQASGVDANDASALATSGATTPDSWTVAVNTPPTACISVDATVRDLGQAVSVSASCSTDVEDALAALTVEWDWDNNGTWDEGPLAASASSSHAFGTTGVKVISARVRDSIGDAGYRSTRIVVAPAAQTYVVSNTNAAGAGSLAAAITAANANADLSTIRFDPAVFAGPPTTIALGNTTLNITQPLQIVGRGGVRVQGDRTLFNTTASGVTLAYLELVGNTGGAAYACVTASGADLWLFSTTVRDCETGLLVSGNSAEIGPDNRFEGDEIAIDITGGSGHLVHHNRVLTCSDTACLQFANGTGPSDVIGNLFANSSVPLILVGNATGLSFLHNTLHGSTTYGITLGGSGHTVHNNIFSNNSSGAICDSSGLTATSNGYNALFDNGAATACPAPVGTGQVNANPLYVNAASLNFALQAGSPCIDTGTPTVILDVNGAAPNLYDGLGPDMGAYERPQP